MDTKRCSKCEIEKPLSEFSIQNTSKDKLRNFCKRCDYILKSKWQNNNKERYNKYFRDRIANDETFRLAKNLRNRLGQALLKQSTRKNNKTQDLLGLSFSEFKKYIEFLMTPEMTWKNIELDHIQPLKSFNLTDPNQLKEAAHYTNIQPLLKSDNRKKGSRIHEHDLAVHNEKIYEYEYFKYYLNN